MAADNQHISPRLKHKKEIKWEIKIKNRSATRERSRSSVIDSAATSSFWQEEGDHIKTGIELNKIVMIPTVNTDTASEKGLLLNGKLNEKSKEIDILPELNVFITKCLQVSRCRIHYNISSR